MSQKSIVSILIAAELILTASAVLFPVKALAIVISSVILLLILVVFIIFALDLIKDIRGRGSLSAAFLLTWSICSMIVLFGNLFRWSNIKDSVITDYEAHSKLLASIYFSVVTWTTLGYGDITPTANSRIVASIEAMTGYIVMALLIAVFVAMAQASQKPD